MLKFDHPEHDAHFELPEEWTIQNALDYDSVVEGLQDESMYVRLWEAFRQVINEEDWHCEGVSLDTSLQDKMEKKKFDIIKWASLVGWSVRRSMERTEKN